MSGQGDDGSAGPYSDPVALSSDIGTWAAAFIAIVALVGIIGPYLALQASLSDRNRAMNAVHDRPQKYITNGIPFTKGFRIFRRIYVPNLSPSYITNEPEIRRLIPQRAATARWTLRPRDYLAWNSGWAKLSELIESYEPHDVDSNRPVDLKVDRKNGTLEIVNSRTALVVSKYWILLLGLLGRYGQRRDKGILQNTGVRRDFEGERGLIQNFLVVEEEKEKKKERVLDGLYGAAQPELETRRRRRFHTRASSYDSRDDERSRSSSRTDSSGRKLAEALNQFALEAKRGAYGGWTLERHAKPTIHGITGTMEALGRHKGSWSYLTSISFVPHTTREILPPGNTEGSDQSSLETHFWLAHGFLPCALSNGKRTIIPLEDPLNGTDVTSSSLFKPPQSSDADSLFRAFSLQPSEDLPVSIGNAMRCLGIPEPEVLQFIPVEPVYLPVQNSFIINRRSRSPPSTDSFSSSEHEHTTRYRSRYRKKDAVYVKIKEKHVYFSKPGRRENFALMRKDLERMISAFLTLDWDPWGYLIWKDGFWAGILTNATSLFRLPTLTAKSLGTLLGSTATMNAAIWAVGTKFDARKINDFRELENLLSSTLQGSEILPLRLAIGTLYMLDASCRSQVENACKRLLAGHNNSTLEADIQQLKNEAQNLEKVFEEMKKNFEQKWTTEKEGYEAESKRKYAESKKMYGKDEKQIQSPEKDGPAEDGNTGLSQPPTWTRMSFDHVDFRVLRFYNVTYVGDPDDRGFMLIKRLIPDWEQKIFFDHTRKLRSLDERMGQHQQSKYKMMEDIELLKFKRDKLEVLREGSLQFDYDSKELKWYSGSVEKAKSESWRLKDDISGMPGCEPKVSISEREMVLVGLWVATRAMLWLSSQDSKPLLKFIDDLDPHVYVL